jgi:hypothetical protein
MVTYKQQINDLLRRINMNTPAPDFMTIPSSVTSYANEFNKYSKNTIENFLNMCHIVIIAKHKLESRVDFPQFCKDIGEGSASAASISKMLKIGKHYRILYDNRDKLPSAWTTLYALASLPKHVLEQSLENNVIHKSFDGKAARALMPPKMKRESATLNEFSTEPQSEQSESNVDAPETNVTVDATTEVTTQTPSVTSINPIIRKSTLEIIIEGEIADQLQETLLNDLISACERMGCNVVEFGVR